MEASDVTLYHAVTDTDQMKTVLERLSEAGGEVVVRSPVGAMALRSNPGVTDHNELIVNKSPENSTFFDSHDQFSVWFEFPDGTYFFECVPRVAEEQIFLSPDKCLFKQQRRSEFRYVIPKGYKVIFDIQAPFSQALYVKDVNQAGFGLEVPSDFPLNVGDRIEGELIIGEHKPVRLAADIRRRQEIQGRMLVGLEFNHTVFGSEVDLSERLLFLRLDVYYLNRLG